MRAPLSKKWWQCVPSARCIARDSPPWSGPPASNLGATRSCCPRGSCTPWGQRYSGRNRWPREHDRARRWYPCWCWSGFRCRPVSGTRETRGAGSSSSGWECAMPCSLSQEGLSPPREDCCHWRDLRREGCYRWRDRRCCRICRIGSRRRTTQRLRSRDLSRCERPKRCCSPARLLWRHWSVRHSGPLRWRPGIDRAWARSLRPRCLWLRRRLRCWEKRPFRWSIPLCSRCSVRSGFGLEWRASKHRMRSGWRPAPKLFVRRAS